MNGPGGACCAGERQQPVGVRDMLIGREKRPHCGEAMLTINLERSTHTYVIGDVHGMLYKLEKLLDKIPFRQNRDTIVFLGDYVDRGPHSKGVLDLILSLIDQGLHIICLRGNHELMWLNFMRNKDPHMFLCNGGYTTLLSYQESPGRQKDVTVPGRHMALLQGMLPYYEMEDFILVHAGLRPDIPLAQQTEDDLYWIRDEFICSDYDFGKTLVFGHTPFDKPYVGKNRIGIDTGAVYGNKLTCVRLPDLVFYSV
jgi:serine/threonine protein phosphatase 1